MSPLAVALLTYVWHYLIARTIYDQLVRPIEHGNFSVVLLVACAAAVAFAVGRVTRARP
jgi:cation transport ATPase